MIVGRTIGLMLALVAGLCLSARAQEEQAERLEGAEPANAQSPLAKYVTVTSPIGDAVFARVKNEALALQNLAVQQDRKAMLILEISPGSSQFHQVLGLAKELTSRELSKVTTVAWIPQTVTGHNAILALAANEIVMHPDAELGDIGLGKALEPDERQSVLSLIEKRRNPKLSTALVQGMLDPQVAVLQASVQVGPAGMETSETRVVTPEELQRLKDVPLPVTNVQTIKEAGLVGTFSGEQARTLGVLVSQTVDTRAELTQAYNLPAEALREDPTASGTPKVRLIEIKDTIDPIVESFVERQIDRAVASGANTLIFEIQSPGGYLLQSQNLAEAIAELDPKNVRTIAYIPKEAYSGAAIIALGADDIYMHPDAKIGDAGPIEMREGGQFQRAPEKILSPLLQVMESLAERKNRPTAVAMAMVDKDLEVFRVTNRDTGRVWFMTDAQIHESNGEWVKGPLVPESRKGLLLTVDGTRAHELKLAQPPVRDMDDLKERLAIPADMDIVKVGRTWVDSLVFLLNTSVMQFFILVAAVVFLYLELHIVTGLFGILSAVCFGLFFWSNFLGGTAGWLEVTLFLIGLACLAIEIFVIPGLTVFGITGGLLLISSLVLASQTFGNLEPGSDLRQLSNTVGLLSLSLVSVIVLALVMNRFLPKIPLFRHMELAPPGYVELGSEPQLRPELAGSAAGAGGMIFRVGQSGEAVTTLRPAGKAYIGGEYIDVVSDGPYIQRGAAVEIVEVLGNRIVVREA